MLFLKLKKSFSPVLTFFLLLTLSACFPGNKSSRLLVNGAGASFPFILYSRWLSEYRKVQPQVSINYQSIGSGGGIRQFINGTLDFGGTDVPVSKEDLKSTKKKILHIPTALGAVAVTYNIPGDSKKSLRLSAEVLTDIFTGKIKSWDDSRIQEINPDFPLPGKSIVPIYRADGSGTTSFFTEYLSLASKNFLKEVGKGKSVPWPVGIGGKGNEGVMGLVNKIDGAIAYIGVSYAVSQKLPMAAVQNKAGQFVKPSLKSIKEAARQSMKRQKSYTDSLINIEGENSYPISGFTYIIISKKMPKEKGEVIVNFLKWTLKEGQKFSESLYFIPLPVSVVQVALKQLSQVEWK